MYRFSHGARRVLSQKGNKHFGNAEGATGVYGHAFIFRVKRQASQGEGREVEYENLDKSFINSAFKGEGLSAS